MGEYKVEYLESSPDPTDVTDFIYQMDDTHLYSDGRISTTSFTLQAEFGQFITDDNDDTTPIISQFDRFRLTYTSVTGDFYQKIFEVINDLGQHTGQGDYLLPLTLEGRERNLALIPFSGYFDPPLNHFEIVQKIMDVYVNTIAFDGKQPIISPNDIFLPQYNPNFWDFQYIDNCLDALKSVVRLADQSVAAGGGGDRFAIIFKDVDFDVSPDLMTMDIVSQGSIASSETIIITGDGVFNPIQSTAKIKQPLTGTAVIARGRPGSGGTPRQGDQYRSRLEFFQRIFVEQVYNDAIIYDIDAFANQGGVVFQALTQNEGVTPVEGSNWTAITAGDFIGDIQYSPLTIDKAELYKNECTHPGDTFDPESEDSPKMLDYNIFINDDSPNDTNSKTQRDWVHFRSVTDIIVKGTDEARYLFIPTAGNDAIIFEGIRILVDTTLGSLAGRFNQNLFGTGTGNDPNGRAYADSACVFTGGKWFVIKETEQFDQIVVRFEGLFEFNNAFVSQSRFPASDANSPNTRRFRNSTGQVGSNAWRELGDQFLANDCLHSPSSIDNVTGLIEPVEEAGGGTFYTDDSAVKIIYEYGNKPDLDFWDKALNNLAGVFATASGFLGNLALSAASATYQLFTTPFYRNVGWWITLSAPFPLNTFNGITEKVGELYGGGDYGTGVGEDVAALKRLNNHAYFDKYNERVALQGGAGWNETDSEDLMEITGVTFLFNLDILADGNRIPFTGQIPTAYWCMDSNGTLWKNTKPYRFLGDTQRMIFTFGDFSPVYRARTPFGISNVVTNILVPELEIRERLIPSRIVIQGFQLEAAYDEHGRYMPSFWENIIKPTIFSMFSSNAFSTNVEFVGIFDYFQWIKTPIAIAKDESFDRIIFPEIKDYPNITNIEQLNRAALADIDVATFQYEQYTLTQNDVADFALQNTVYLRDEFLINDSDLLVADVDAWVVLTDYILNDIVTNGFAPNIYTCIKTHTSSIFNQPPNAEFWFDEGTVSVPNTRKLVGAEIVLSVTDSRDWQRTATLPRRIPRVTA